jgi:hypothetical protein
MIRSYPLEYNDPPWQSELDRINKDEFIKNWERGEEGSAHQKKVERNDIEDNPSGGNIVNGELCSQSIKDKM